MLSRNEATGETEARRVTATTAHLSAQTVTVTLTDPKTGEHQSIVCTPNHPFYVAGQGFTPAGSLGIGTSIVTRAGPSLAVSNVQFQPASTGGVMVYNLTVEGDHTYFVGTLDGGAWVHNAICTREKRWVQLAQAPNSRLSKQLRDFILRNKGARVAEVFGLELAHRPRFSNVQGYDYADTVPRTIADHRGIEHRYLRESRNGTRIGMPRNGPQGTGPLSRPFPGTLP